MLHDCGRRKQLTACPLLHYPLVSSLISKYSLTSSAIPDAHALGSRAACLAQNCDEPIRIPIGTYDSKLYGVPFYGILASD